MMEIEVRGPLTKLQHKELIAFLNTHASFKEEKHRIFLDYSSFLNHQGVARRNLDVRVRETNGQPELMIKLGRWRGKDVRKEVSVKLQPGNFSPMVEALAALGIKKGFVVERTSRVYDYKTMECTVNWFTGWHQGEFEVEAGGTTSDAPKLHKEIKKMCDDLGLRIFTDQEFYNTLNRFNKVAAYKFDFRKDGPDYFKRKYKI